MPDLETLGQLTPLLTASDCRDRAFGDEFNITYTNTNAEGEQAWQVPDSVSSPNHSFATATDPHYLLEDSVRCDDTMSQDLFAVDSRADGGLEVAWPATLSPY